MASPRQQNPSSAFIPTTDRRKDGDDYVAGGGCGCFRRFCFGWDDGGESHNYLLQGRGERRGHKEAWVAAQLKKLKEFSELVAGPKWKNFIRKIGRIFKHNNNNNNSNKQRMDFQYSPQSYALNFVGDRDEEEDGNLQHSFSTRFATHALINDEQRRAGL
ncbi:hypothetical protein Salat_0943700 [Sesamum alatum]|uniref:Stress induced protein n=1 Tax=Sesamum alatum TaxID=300844 RepID=A0AAE1YK98_9LAMI|nr:hypothetical protein Salat_0943700 [Sesamum alatum]